ncbi:MAG: Short-chain dehydrogenase/reductase sdr [Spirochaetes bacterium]|nr:MAG: Short-chain dehydrogenase/reductase sdr [Spirochaetota bacterium]
MDFKGKRVLITGAGAGIGRAAAVLFARAGARVAVNSLTRRSVEATLALVRAECARSDCLEGQSIFVQGDVSLAEDAQMLVKRAVDAFGGIDILVNCAGIVVGGRIEDVSEEDYQRVMDVNVKGTFLVSKYALPHLRASGAAGPTGAAGAGSVIVNVASILAVKGVPDRGIYSASKGAVLSLTKAMAADHIREHIRVNAVCPGTTDTPSLEARLAAFPDPAAAKSAFTARQPMGRLGRAEEIAHAILFAACDEAGFMTGAVINIDGGMSI